MGLLMSDTVLIDPLLDDTVRLRDGLGAWACALDATCHGSVHEAADLSDWRRLSFQTVAWATEADS
jgi:hypothetical protein